MKSNGNLSSLIHLLNTLLQKDAPCEECEKSFKSSKAKRLGRWMSYSTTTLPFLFVWLGIPPFTVWVQPSPMWGRSCLHPDLCFQVNVLFTSGKGNFVTNTKFNMYLYGQKFTLVTDHKPLTTYWVLTRDLSQWPLHDCNIGLLNCCIVIWLNFVALLNTVIQMVSPDFHWITSILRGTHRTLLSLTFSNWIACLLQLHSWPKLLAQIDRKVYRHITKGWPDRVSPNLMSFMQTMLTVEGVCVLWGVRGVVPAKCREKLLNELHHDHPGICKMKSIARSYIWWQGLDKNIETLAKSCTTHLAIKNLHHSTPRFGHREFSSVFTLILLVHFKVSCLCL